MYTSCVFIPITGTHIYSSVLSLMHFKSCAIRAMRLSDKQRCFFIPYTYNILKTFTAACICGVCYINSDYVIDYKYYKAHTQKIDHKPFIKEKKWYILYNYQFNLTFCTIVINAKRTIITFRKSDCTVICCKLFQTYCST